MPSFAFVRAHPNLAVSVTSPTPPPRTLYVVGVLVMLVVC